MELCLPFMSRGLLTKLCICIVFYPQYFEVVTFFFLFLMLCPVWCFVPSRNRDS